LESFIVTNREQQKFCPLEIVYLMAKDGKYEEKFLYEYRKELGANLAKEFPDLKADFVI
jgi:glutamine phosphoribosylpyrophosphate amidotransferase